MITDDLGVPVVPQHGHWYDVEWTTCIRCDGTGEHVECFDDLCHAQNHCMHGDNLCALCEGVGRITEDLAERWTNRESFAGVRATDADLHVRGSLHRIARRRHGRVVGDD